MADFAPAFERTLANEGGYQLTDIKGDKGGQTYAGIARKRNPSWPGWHAIDAGDTPASGLVRDYYRDHYWAPVRGDKIADQAIAADIYDFGVNAGPAVAVKLAQIVVGVTPDGIAGPKTVAAINELPPLPTVEEWRAVQRQLFLARYALAKLARYRDIVQRDRSQQRFLLGWINRVLKGVA